MHWRLLLTAICVCLGGSFHYGIQLTVLNPSESVFHQFVNVTHHQHYGSYLTDSSYRILWSVILNLLLAGNIIGTLPLVKLSESLGRLKTFYVSAGLMLIGLVCQWLSKVVSAYELFAFGRLAVGTGLGIALPLQNMYFSEISPVVSRGFVGGMTGIFVELGYLLGGVLGLPVTLGTPTRWMYIFLVEAAPVVLLLIILPFLHESPRYLTSRQKLDAAKKSLQFFGHKDINASILKIQTELRCQKNRSEWKELWRKAHLRRAVCLSILVLLTQSFSGIIVIDYFSTTILTDVGLSMETAQYAAVGIFAGTLVAVCFGGAIVDRVGRRFLLLASTSAMILCSTALMVFSVVYNHDGATWAGIASVVACASLTLAFGFGPSILQWVVAAELVPQNARSQVQLVGAVAQKVMSTSVGILFFPLQGIIGPLAFLIFIVPLCVVFVILYFKFPETKRKTVLEVMNALGFEEDGIPLLAG